VFSHRWPGPSVAERAGARQAAIKSPYACRVSWRVAPESQSMIRPLLPDTVLIPRTGRKPRETEGSSGKAIGTSRRDLGLRAKSWTRFVPPSQIATHPLDRTLSNTSRPRLHTRLTHTPGLDSVASACPRRSRTADETGVIVGATRVTLSATSVTPGHQRSWVTSRPDSREDCRAVSLSPSGRLRRDVSSVPSSFGMNVPELADPQASNTPPLP
jgi:hypothetical protein